MLVYVLFVLRILTPPPPPLNSLFLITINIRWGIFCSFLDQDSGIIRSCWVRATLRGYEHTHTRGLFLDFIKYKGRGNLFVAKYVKAPNNKRSSKFIISKQLRCFQMYSSLLCKDFSPYCLYWPIIVSEILLIISNLFNFSEDLII